MSFTFLTITHQRSVSWNRKLQSTKSLPIYLNPTLIFSQPCFHFCHMIFQSHSSQIFIHTIKVMFYNPTYFNLEILIIPLKKCSPQTNILGFYQKKLYQWTGRLQGHVQKVSANVVSPNPLSPTPETWKKLLMTLNQKMKKISTWNTPLSSCTA